MDNQKYARQRWAQSRAAAEKKFRQKAALSSLGKVRRFRNTAHLFGRVLRFTPMYERGLYNAAHPRLIKKDLVFKTLPKAFNGYTILHLTDLHLDFIPELPHRICSLVKGIRPDICVMTGDYVTEYRKDKFKEILTPMEQIASAVNARDGVCAILGNHDTWGMVEHFEDMGICVLVNETYEVQRKNTAISITGVDDPHEYLTSEAVQALKTPYNHSSYNNSVDKNFKVALVHTPELYQEAEENGYDLYLAGHTHGGQICLPGGIPLVLHLNKGHRYGKGLWQYRSMTGYSSQGAGAVGIPIRLNTFSEVTLLTLRSEAAQQRRRVENK